MNEPEELREEILTEFKQVHKLAPADYTENCTNVVMSLVKAHTDKAVKEARISEAMNCRKMTTGCDQRDYDKRLVTRIKELQEGKE